MSELKKLTREEAIVTTEDSLNFWKSGNYKDHDEPDIKRNIEYYEMLLNSLRKPRFTTVERKAMNNVIGFAKDGAEMGFENDLIINGEEHASCAMNAALRDIATVRKMLEGLV